MDSTGNCINKRTENGGKEKLEDKKGIETQFPKYSIELLW